MPALQRSELPEGITFTAPPSAIRAGDYLQASVHGYSLVESVTHTEFSTVIHFAEGGSEAGYPYARAIHRPN